MEKVKFDYSRLKGKIVEKCGSQKEFAKRLGISESTLISKLSGRTFFNQKEIDMAIEILEIPKGQVTDYFFTT